MKLYSFIFGVIPLFAVSSAASAGTCDRACLLEEAKLFNVASSAALQRKSNLPMLQRFARTQRSSHLAIAGGSG
jgi:hypothetical protein